MKLLLSTLMLALAGCTVPPTPQEMRARANTVEFVHVHDRVMILRYDERGELEP